MIRTQTTSKRRRTASPNVAQIQPLEGRVLFAAADLDPTFSGDGKALVDFYGTPSVATAVAVQADGKVLLAGTVQVPGPQASLFPDLAVGIARLNADGSVDKTFGRGGDDGDGRITIKTLVDRSSGRTESVDAGAADLVLLPDGKFLIATSRAERPEVDAGGTAVLRFNSDGTLDNTFGFGDGIALIDFGSDPFDYVADETAAALAVGPTGKIVIVASIPGFKVDTAGVAVLNPDGTPDATFRPSQFGEFRNRFRVGGEDSGAPNDVAVGPDGDIFVTGTSVNEFFDDAFVLKIGADGSLKSNGQEIFLNTDDIPPHSGAEGEAVAVAPNGDVLVGGSVSFEDGRSDFALVPVFPHSGFGGGEEVTSHFAGAPADVHDLAVVPSGKIVAVGGAGSTFALARFNADGSPDATFDSSDATPDGRKTTGFTGGATARGVAIAPDGKIVVVGAAGGAAASDMAVARYKGDGVVTPPSGPVTYQAEDAARSGAVVGRSYAGYTGSGYVDFVNNSGDYVEWTVNASASGQNRLDFRYANGSSSTRSMSVSVDGKVVQGAMLFAPTGSWSTWKTASVFPTLTGGRHTVRLLATGQSGPNVDALTVTPPAATTRYEAEDAARKGAVVGRSYAGYTGTGYVDVANASGDYVEWTVNVGKAGLYDLDFRYANGGSGRPMALTIDGAAQPGNRLAFIGTGSWSTWKIEGAAAQLTAGTHRIRVTAIGSSGPNIDSLTLRPA
jgi:uncharacterized delta-60 repeat protein